MSDKSVNVESRTSSQDKRWTIMAALLGTNTAVMLFQGIEQESDPKQIREIALSIIAATLPFQGIYFLIYTYMLENNGKLSEKGGGGLGLIDIAKKSRNKLQYSFKEIDDDYSFFTLTVNILK